MASSQNTIRTRNILSAGVIIIRRRINYPRGRTQPRIFDFFSGKNLTVPKIVPQCRKYPIAYLYTLRRTITYALPNASPYLKTCISYLNTSAFGSRIHILIHAAPTFSRLHILIHCRLVSSRQPIRIERHLRRQPIKIEHGKNPSTSSANQNRVLRHPRALGQGGVPFSALGSRRLKSARYSLS